MIHENETAPERTCKVCGCTDARACYDELTHACWWVGDHLCSHCAQPDARRRLAQVAAAQLSEVVAELLRFVREGDQETVTPFALEPAENTADALRSIIRIEQAKADPIESEANQMLGAIDRFIDGWA